MGNRAAKEAIMSPKTGAPATTIFDFTVEQALSAEPISLSSFCGLTNQNYQELQQLYDKYNQDLEILAFPCNNFGGQEPGTNAEVVEFAKDKGATFPVLGKLECDNGDKTAPLYKFLMNSIEDKGTTGFVLGQGLKWNFAKFLCDKDGKPVKRYFPTSNPLSIEPDIVDIISKG